ncbi:MAG: helicase-related protein [Giesbergeria sp.]
MPARRQLLEQRFRYTEKDRKDWLDNPAHEAPLERLPVMFCSPTMELGVDISALNTVYLRNVPPTPANYAQRSGRAGRSGQQALVITYCAALSPHDQWFFHHATDMVHGIVKPPTLDLANRDLVESHLHAVWLAAAQVQLDTSIAPLLDLEQPDKPLATGAARRAGRSRSHRTAPCTAPSASWPSWRPSLQGSPWFSPRPRRRPPCSVPPTTSAPPSSAGACWSTPPASRWTWPTRSSRATPPPMPRSRTPSAATATPPASTPCCSSPATARTPTSTPTATWPARAFCRATTSRACRSWPGFRPRAAPPPRARTTKAAWSAGRAFWRCPNSARAA